jgi:hypothetical protein
MKQERGMSTEERLAEKLSRLDPDERRMLAELADFFLSRRDESGGQGALPDDDWDQLALASLLSDADHPDEVDYTLADAREVFAR